VLKAVEPDIGVMVSVEESREDHGDLAVRSPVRSVVRALELLQLFNEDNCVRHVRDLTTISKLPRTTVLRLMSTLEAQGFVVQAGESLFQIGPTALRWLSTVQNAWRINDESLSELRALRDLSGESVNLNVRQGLSRVSIGQAEGTHTVRSVVPLGKRFPLGPGSSGRILLAHAPETVIAEVVRNADNPESLMRGIEKYRRDGYYFSHGERESGASSLSLPIRISTGQVVSLSMSGPSARFTKESMVRYIEFARKSATKIESIGLGAVESLLE
jgi:DNA-binding IclR family transcriptional regulator